MRGDMSDAKWQLEPLARSVPEARRCVRMTLTGWGLDAILDTVVLLTSEIVTNAVLHARTDFTLGIAKVGVDGVRVSVSDASPVPPAMRARSDTATTGRGLRLLDQLASEWHTDENNGGKTVWFTVTAADDPWAAPQQDAQSYSTP